MIQLETPRLILRRMTLNDIDALYKITGNAEVMRFVGNNKPISRGETRLLIEKSLSYYERHACGVFGVIEKASGCLVGYCGFSFKNPELPEILYGFDRSCWGRGIGFEAAKATVDYGFSAYGFHRVIATVDPANAASVRIIEKLGMKWVENRLDEHGLPEALYELKGYRSQAYRKPSASIP